MENEFKFTWDTMSLFFPEWAGKEKEFFKDTFPESPEFSDKKIFFRYKGDYGVELFLNQDIPEWVPKDSKEYKLLNKMRLELSKHLYENTITELDSSFDILQSWRKFVKKYEKGELVGNLNTHLYFETEEVDKITLGDGYYFNPGENGDNNSPTKVLTKIQKIPRASLNETWMKYFNLANNVERRLFKGECNTIKGKDLTECIRNADEIYKVADELKRLNFY